MKELKSMDIAWRSDYTYTDFVTDNIFDELDKSLASLNGIKNKLSSLNNILNDCTGSQITIIKNHLSQINSYITGLIEKYENHKNNVQAKANIFQAKCNQEFEKDEESFPTGSFYSTYLYYRNGIEIDPDTEVGGEDDNNNYTIYHFSISTCTRNIHGSINRTIKVTNHIFTGKSVTTPLKIRYKGTFPSHSTKTFVHYYKYNDGVWEDINLRNLINYM